MKQKKNLVTYKIKYVCDVSIKEVIQQYNNVLKYTYNRLKENPELSTKELTIKQQGIKHCDLIGSHLKNSAIYESKALISKNGDKPIIFGGKKLFMQRCQKKVTKEEFKEKRLVPLCSVGEACHKSNRLFQLQENNVVLFKLNKLQHFVLTLKNVGKKREKELKQLLELQNNKLIPITYKLDLNYIYITFDYNALKVYTYKVKENRVLAIDMNPNSIGWSIVDWYSGSNYTIIKSGTFSLKPLNDYRNGLSVSSDSVQNKYVTNKRNHEVIHIAKDLFNICKYYKCEIFSIESLNIVSTENKKGHRYNRLVNNQWNRDLLINQIRKHVNSSSTVLIEVQPQWNSYIGNLIFRKEQLPDECLASIEIGRRGYEFGTQYIFKRRPQEKTVIYPKLELFKEQLTLSLEELGIVVNNLDSWTNILKLVKESKVKYRFSTSIAQEVYKDGLFSKFYKQKYLYVYEYI